MHTFRITTHIGLDGVRLSCDGGWGGIPFPDDASAARAAAASAGRDQHRIVRGTIKPRPRVMRDTDPDWLLT